MKLVPKDHTTDLQTYGIKRSGNHAIIFWILGHFENYIFYNNCTAKQSEVFHKDDEPPTQNSSPERCVISFEDDLEKNVCMLPTLGNLLPSATKRILILRDPFNTYASRIKQYSKVKRFHDGWKNLDFWKESAKEYLGITNYLGETLKINYNHWFKDLQYRKDLSKNFGTFQDKNINKVSNIGGGSSFDGTSFDGKARDMNVLNRWREFSRNKFFKDITKDEELMDLSSKIFGNMFKI